MLTTEAVQTKIKTSTKLQFQYNNHHVLQPSFFLQSLELFYSTQIVHRFIKLKISLASNLIYVVSFQKITLTKTHLKHALQLKNT